jgi:hypothetical protein
LDTYSFGVTITSTRSLGGKMLDFVCFDSV